MQRKTNPLRVHRRHLAEFLCLIIPSCLLLVRAVYPQKASLQVNPSALTVELHLESSERRLMQAMLSCYVPELAFNRQADRVRDDELIGHAILAELENGNENPARNDA